MFLKVFFQFVPFPFVILHLLLLIESFNWPDFILILMHLINFHYSFCDSIHIFVFLLVKNK